MENFEFVCPTKVIFGKGTEQLVGVETKRYTNKILLHYGQGSVMTSGLYDRVVKSLEEADVGYVTLGGVLPNPRLSLIKNGIKLCRENNVGLILAIGGGSVIDSAKAISVGVPYNGDVWDFFLEKTQPKDALPVGSILTLAATGSEMSWSSVITNEEDSLKRHLDSELIVPKFAIMNPELTMTLPAYQTACGITDIMAHTMERYFTQVQNVELTDKLCEGTLKTLINVADSVIKNPKDYNARAEIMWAGSIAHNNILGTGRIGDWATHMIEHEISAINDIAHGAGLAVIFPAWMKYVYKHNMERFFQYAVKVWGIDESFSNPQKTILKAIDKQIQFYKLLGLPVTLREIGISKNDFKSIAEKCRKFDPINETVGNFVKLTKQDIINILELAY